MKALRLLCYFMAGMTLGAFAAASAFAETIPANSAGSGFTYTGQGCYTSAAAACAAAPGDFNSPFCDNIPGWPSRMGLGSCQHPPSCPTTGGWTLQGSSCYRPDCPAGTTRNPENGSCSLPACPDGQTRGGSGTGECLNQCAGAGSSGGQSGQQYKVASTASSSYCATDGCSYKPSDCVGVNGQNYCWMGKSTGSSCNSTARNADGSDHQTAQQQAEAKTTADQNACLVQGKCPITINGIVTCGQCSSASTNSSSTTTNPDGSSTSTNTNTNCTINGGQVNCGTTTTTTNNPAGGGQGTTTTGNTTTEGNTASFCAQNPASPICSPQQTECDKNPNLAQCKELGDAPENPDLATQSFGVESLSPVSLPGVAACPAPIALPYGMSFSWEGMCMFLEGLRPVVLALAWLAAGFIVLGVNRDG